MKHSPKALLIATMDTKGSEALYMKSCLEAAGVTVMLMDAGIRGESPVPVDIDRIQVAQAGGKPMEAVRTIGHEGKALAVMAEGAVKIASKLYRQGRFHGVIGLGGSMGTTLGTAVMRALPVGVPKTMISTMASRDTRAFVGTKDILMLHSVCDLSGLNRVTRGILKNGAAALAGMLNYVASEKTVETHLVFISTLGTTEACAQQIRKSLEAKGREVVIFHTVGSGGKAMEEMLAQEKVTALVDLSLHEIADHHFGGDYDAGPDRGKAALRHGIPTILVPGNIDFLVSGPLEAARPRFPHRPYHVHNAAITVFRTSREELKTLGKIIADICNPAEGPLTILIPMGGFSAFDAKDGPLHDPEGPKWFADALRQHLDEKIKLDLLPYDINDPEFAGAVIEVLARMEKNDV
ncbi:MAG: Tm-1-like ATP-binding domain-containing protein [Deltaproteobacteria bacterium]|nr:Tm-1-like ATP-binding domain-containing protein [Deltaproteobacteria bacterium]